jgi:hypothetical protein
MDGFVRNNVSYDAWGAPQKIYSPPIIGMRKINIATEYTTYAYDEVLKIYEQIGTNRLRSRWLCPVNKNLWYN